MMTKKFTSISETFLSIDDNSNYNEINDIDISPLEYEIDLISDPKIKKFVRFLLKHTLPFWNAPSSLIPDVHPPDEEIKGGLVLHTKRVIRTIMVLASTFEINSPVEMDCLIAAALLHDITKFIFDEKTEQFLFDPMHPYTVDRYVDWSIEECLNVGKADEDTTIEVDTEYIEVILRLVRCSHGIWSPIPETIPATILERALHESDLIATNIHLICDGNEVKKEKWV